MLKPVLSLVFVALTAQVSGAACGGQDMRANLSDQDAASLAGYVESQPYTVGNHWRAEKAGQVVHVVGTMHLDDPAFDGVMELLTPVLRSADAILLEMTPAEQRALESALVSDPDMLLLQDATLPELLDEATWQELSQAASDRGIPSFMAAKFQPWYLSMMLAIPPCAMTAFTQGEGGLDGQIMAFAEENDIPMQALEPFDTAFRAFNSEPLEAQIEMMQGGIVSAEDSENMFATLRATYFEQQHGASWEMSRILAMQAGGDAALNAKAFDKMQDQLLWDRNRSWIPVILEQTGQMLVVAAGAAHLHGEEGVLNLLRQNGYTLTQQEF